MWRRQWHHTPALLPGKSHGRRSLVSCSPWGCEESDTTERLPFHFSLSCIGEGNGNTLQCSCLENPRDGGAWWAAVYRVAQSRTLLTCLNSSSSSWVCRVLPTSSVEGFPWWAYPLQGKNFLQVSEYLHQQRYTMALPSLMAFNNPKMDWCNTLYFNCGHNVTFNFWPFI